VHAVALEDAQVELQSGSARGIGAGDAERHPERDGGSRLAHARRSITQLLLCGLLASPVAALEPELKPTVIVLSLDGTRHDYPARTDTPALDRIEREGARAGALVPVSPANTFPNHVSLATGTYPDRHGIVGSSFIDAERGRFHYSNDASWIEAEPIWVTAERQGVRSAVFFWVGSETRWHGVEASYRKTPFDSGVPESRKVDQILAWLDLHAAERPRLILSWWHGCDHQGHERGPDHPSIATQLRAQDAQLGRLLEGLDAREAWKHTTLFVVSDHGMTTIERPIDPVAELEAKGIKARLVRAGGTGFVWLDDPDQAGRALELLRGIDGVRAWPSAALPDGMRSYYPDRTGQITVLADPPGVFADPGAFRRSLVALGRLAGGSRGMHGFSPEHSDMHGIFYAMGRGVPAGARPERVHVTELAATVSRVLGIEPPRDAEGKPVPGIGGP
jgi:arylsulfatase A-like enzyme